MDRDWREADAEREGIPRLSIILPCFNEAGNIPALYRKLLEACDGYPREFLFVDDGSSDATAAEVERLSQLDPAVKLLRFIRNAGHQHALRAGYRAAKGDFVLTLDADLQHPPEAIPAMLAKAKEGFDVVQMIREGQQPGLLKELASRAFYKIFNSLSDVPMVAQGSDFRLVTRYVADILNALPERNLVVRAILPYLGFRTASIPYRVGQRLHGQASYGFAKSLRLGSQALFQFSTFPLKAAMRLGGIISALAFAYGIYNVAAKFFTDDNVPGYTDLIASSLFLGGIILLYLGVLGRYMLVILDHLKQRPEYLLSGDKVPPTQHPKPLKTERPAGRRAEAPG